MTRIVVATRRFTGPLGAAYAVPEERLSDKATLVRLASASPDYRVKEEMHAEVACFADNLVAWIAAQDRAPDLIHAHYADAATVAALVEDRLGIPFVFTAHSLGQVKAMMLGASPCAPISPAASPPRRTPWRGPTSSSPPRGTRRRCNTRAMTPTIPAGSASCPRQRPRPLRGGPSASPRRCRHRPLPARSGQAHDPRLARPVARKNLAALVRAYGESAALRARANLVIVAGTREDIDALDGDMAETMRDLLVLIDRYDLYGRVAYPKTTGRRTCRRSTPMPATGVACSSTRPSTSPSA